MTILRTRVVIRRVSGDGGVGTVETSTAASGTTPTFAADSTTSRSASTESVLAFGELTGPAIETALLATEDDAENVAAYLAGINSAYPQLADVIVDNETGANLEVIRDVDLNDRVEAIESYTGSILDSFVEAVEHRITNGGLRHECRLLVSSRGRSTGIFADDADAADPDVFSQFTDDPPEGLTYAVFGY